MFFRFPSILTFDFILILGSLWLFGNPNGLLFVGGNFQELFLGLLIKLKNFYFLCSFNSNFCFWPKFGSFWAFWGSNGLSLGVRVRFKNCFGSTRIVKKTFIFYCSFNYNFRFCLNFGVSFFYILEPYWAIFGVGLVSKNCYGV